MSDLNHKVKSIKYNFLMNSLNKIVPMLIQLITFPYVSRVLLSEGVGKVNYVLSIISYFQLFAAFGIVAYAIAEGAKIRDDNVKLNKFSTEIFALNLATSLIALIAYVVLCSFSVFDNYRGLLAIGSLLIVESTFSVTWVFNIVEDYTHITIRNLVLRILSTLAIFIFIKSPDDVNKYMLISAMQTVFGCAINFIYSRKYVLFFSEKIDKTLFRHIRPMTTIFLLDIFNSIFLNIDVTMLGYMKGDHDVGIYSNAVKISKIICSFISVLSTVLMPRIAYYIKKGYNEKYEEMICYALNFMTLISFPAIIGFILYSKEIILISCGNGFTDSIPVARLLALTLFFMPVNGFVAWQVFIPYHKETLSMVISLIGAILNIVLNAILIPLHTYNAAAFTTILSEFIVFLLLVYYSKNIIRWTNVIKLWWQYGLACISIVLVWVGYKVFLNNINMLVAFLIAVIISIGSYFSILLLLKNPYIMNEFNKVIKR